MSQSALLEIRTSYNICQFLLLLNFEVAPEQLVKETANINKYSINTMNQNGKNYENSYRYGAREREREMFRFIIFPLALIRKSLASFRILWTFVGRKTFHDLRIMQSIMMMSPAHWHA